MSQVDPADADPVGAVPADDGGVDVLGRPGGVGTTTGAEMVEGGLVGTELFAGGVLSSPAAGLP